jgi:predicted ATPase
MKRRAPRPGALPVRRVARHPDAELSERDWPATIPAIAQLLREGLDLAPVTILIGENGSGKSTMVEAIDLTEAGTSQVLLATHSPVVAAIPEARILQLDDDGFHETTWPDLELVQHYRSFLAEPMRYLRHVI